MVDFRTLTCEGIQWQRLGPASADVPWRGQYSTRFQNLGQRLWSVVVDNKPWPGPDWASACLPDTALNPAGAGTAQEFAAEAKNLVGASVVKVRYAFLFQPGGPTRASNQWVNRVRVETREISAAQGWRINLEVRIEDPREYTEGGVAIALLPVRVDARIDTSLKQFRDSLLHLVSPAGVFTV